MPRIIPIQGSSIPTNVTPGLGSAIGSALTNAVSPLLQQQADIRFEEEKFRLAEEERRQKQEAVNAVIDKNVWRQQFEYDVRKNHNPEDYFDVFDAGENEYDQSVLNGRSQTFIETYKNNDKIPRIQAMGTMGTAMRTDILDREKANLSNQLDKAVGAYSTSSVVDTSSFEMIKELYSENGIIPPDDLDRIIEASIMDAKENRVYGLVNNGDFDFAREFLSDAGFSEKRNREFDNIISIEENRANAIALADEFDAITTVDNTVFSMAQSGATYGEIESYVIQNTAPDTMARTLSMKALESRITKPEDAVNQTEETLDRWREQAKELLVTEESSKAVFDAISEIAPEGSPQRDVMMRYAKQFIEQPEVVTQELGPAMAVTEAFSNNNLTKATDIISSTPQDTPARFAAEKVFESKVGMSYSDWSNRSDLQKSQIQTRMFSQSLADMSYDMKSYISNNKSDGYANLSPEVLRGKMQSMSILKSEMDRAYESGLISPDNYGELNSNYMKAVIDSSNALYRKSPDEIDKLPYTHLQSMVDKTYNDPSIPFPVRQRYREIVFSNLADSNNDMFSIQDSGKKSEVINRANATASQFSADALVQAYKKYGLTEEQTRATMKDIGKEAFLPNPFVDAKSFYDSTNEFGIASSSDIEAYLKKSGRGYTPEERQAFNDAYKAFLREGVITPPKSGLSFAGDVYKNGWLVMFEALKPALNPKMDDNNVFVQDFRKLGKNTGGK